MAKMRTVLLPDGNRVTLSAYMQAWKHVKTLPVNATVRGFFPQPAFACEVLSAFREGLDDRINTRGGLDINNTDRTRAWEMDRVKIEQYLYKRYRCSGSRNFLSNPVAKRKYAHIDNQAWE